MKPLMYIQNKQYAHHLGSKQIREVQSSAQPPFPENRQGTQFLRALSIFSMFLPIRPSRASGQRDPALGHCRRCRHRCRGRHCYIDSGR